MASEEAKAKKHINIVMLYTGDENDAVEAAAAVSLEGAPAES